MFKLHDLIAKLLLLDLNEEAAEIMKISQQQMELFPSDDEEEAGAPIPAYSEKDRFDLSSIDMDELLIPKEEQETRFQIIKLLLRDHPRRSKDDIIEEVLTIPTGPGMFEMHTRNYRQVYPELAAVIPPYIPPGQMRIPGTPPQLRFAPDPTVTEEEKRGLERAKIEYDTAVEEFKAKFLEEKGREPRSWEIIGVGTKPRKPQDIVINYNISPEAYKKLEKTLFISYSFVEKLSNELSRLVLEAEAGMPPAPNAVDPESFSTIDEYIEDLKYRIYYYSYKVLSESAGYSIFGATTGRESYSYGNRNIVKKFFTEVERDWYQEPEKFKDFIESSPSALSDVSHWGRKTTIEQWLNSKVSTLNSYADSLSKAIDSYKRGLRFLKRLKKALDKEVSARLEHIKNKELIKYIETNFKDELDLIYQRIVNSLESERSEVARYRNYSQQYGTFTQPHYYHYRSQSEKDEAGLSMFDIELLFHNKIKMYEVIDNFASLILVLINTPIQEAQDSYISPAIKRLARDAQRMMIHETTGLNINPGLNILNNIQEQVVTEFPNGYIIDASQEMLDTIINNWLAYNRDTGVNYQSILMYPKFIIKEQGVKDKVIKNLKNKMAAGLIKSMLIDSHMPDRIYRKIFVLIQEYGAPIEGGTVDEIYENIKASKHWFRIYNNIKNEIFENYRPQTFDNLGYLRSDQEYSVSKSFEIEKDYPELVSIIKIALEEYGPDIGEKEMEERPARYILSSLYANAPGPREMTRSRNVDDLRAAIRKSILKITKVYEDFRYNFFEYLNLDKTEENIEINNKYLKIRDGDKLYARSYGIADVIENPEKFFGMLPILPEIDEDLFFKLATSAGYLKHMIDDFNEYDIEKIKAKYREYSQGRLEINKLVEQLAHDLPAAIQQLKAITYTVYYSDIFSRRMKTFNTVGPRTITKKYKGLGKSLRAKNIPFSGLVKNWSNQTTKEVDEAVDAYIHSEVADGLWPVTDHTRNLYQNAISGMNSMGPAYAAAITIARRADIANPQEFQKIMDLCTSIINQGYNRNFGYNEIKKFVPLIFDNLDNIEGKIKKLYKISEYAHNNGAGLPDSFFTRMLRDPNFKDYGKNNTVNKYFSMCNRLTRLGGLINLRRESQDTIDKLLATGMLARGFYARIKRAYRLCRTGTRIRPNLEGLDREDLRVQEEIKRILEEVETELEAIEEFQTLEEYNELVTQKDPNLFRLNWEVRHKKFRFRVLNDYDPYHFKVGIDSGCCQKLGGVGEAAAIDSYINPLAGVLLLEILYKGAWKMAFQSYFHYVPRSGGYILDNVEHDYRIHNEVKDITGYSSEMLYALLAKRVDENFNVGYFLAGKNYSKIETSDFKKERLGYDPRDFAWKEKYTDWSPSRSLDLLRPKFELADMPKERKGRSKRRAQLFELFNLVKLSVSRQDYQRQRLKNPRLERLIRDWYYDQPESWIEEAYADLEDLGQVALGDKPAALIGEDEPAVIDHRKLAEALINIALGQGKVIIKTLSLVPGVYNYIIGNPDNVEAINQEILRVNNIDPEDPPVDSRYHEMLGKNLGYKEEDIQEFLAGQKY